MTLSLYMDEHVPRSITVGLRLRNIDVLTVQEDGRTGSRDSDILDRAGEIGRIIFTQDDDFLVEAQRRQSAGINFSGIIYAHQLAISIGNCIRDLELITKAETFDELINTVRYLPL
jgi:predicted nuclease of predicted toxin-antitoxin system